MVRPAFKASEAKRKEGSGKPGPFLRFVAVALLAAAFPSASSGQAIRINVVDSATAAPLRGALIALIGADDLPLTEVLTSEAGFGNLSAPAGTYRVRVRRIGYEPYLSPPLIIPSTARLTVFVPAKPIVLSAVVISARSQCGPINSDASGLGAVWNEVAKALQASRLTTADLQGIGGAWTYHKSIGIGGKIEAADTSYFVIRNSRPFVAISAAALGEFGYVVGDAASGWTYYGADETVLLSSEFAAAHCFSLERDTAAPNLIGISFRPVPSRRVADITGVAWVDRKTSELRRITFRYVNAGWISRFGGGGETRFQRLASGAWVVSEWHLRAPRLERTPRAVRPGGFLEDGGGILSPEAWAAVKAARPYR